ncbi:uncharacterized protein THITE_2122581 [Thermothielavioides terrestris NRRL 8126]|uniref:Mitochondrial import inner membrane translocase subunit Tim21 n=1 Tax=Thermothielavioides terrestris (strain ATCC 38088 / NRRL 8126) TaxID=578455 RepID=G2RDL4_THETT|nr:uncharacterized protein THITE_2122581 [Thermothielavioides terrestris NRRL 8126]AEO70799.1 hypothetical protein THITE_2122581 [Thermothielavioides terrestris NRRL 8126]
MMNRVTVSGLRLRPAASTVVARCPSSTAAHSASPLACHDRNDNHSRNGRRHYATQHQPPSSAFASDSRRRAVTPFNDDGRVPWTELSVGEKTARAAQQTFNFGLVILGVALTGGVGYVLYSDVFSSDSKTTHFNRAVDRIRADARCVELLGDGKKIEAFGEETWNKWRRARPIASTVTKDAQGNEHMMIQFNVQGPKGRGRVGIHLIKRPGQHEYEYDYFFVDVGQQRIYLENAAASRVKQGEKKEFRLFGVKWS